MGLRLSRLTSLEGDKLREEHADLLKQITQQRGLALDDVKVYKLMKEETLEIGK